MTRVLVVDDEGLARREIVRLLSDIDGVEIAGQAATVEEAARALDELRPDVVLLDIQLRGESGFDLLDKTDVRFNVIFVTAFDEYAIRAFEVNAVDYLLKPVSPERLREALSRAGLRSDSEGPIAREYTLSDVVIARGRGRTRSFRISDIVSIEANGDYTSVTAGEGSPFLVHRTMKLWVEQLPRSVFYRVHRSVILNLNRLEKIEEDPRNTFRARMNGTDRSFPISRREAARLRGKLS